MSVAEDLGPTLPSRGSVRFVALEVQRLAAVIVEITVEGPNCDVLRAAMLLDKIRAVVGPPSEGEAQ